MKKIVLDKILASAAAGMFIWNAGLGQIIQKKEVSSQPANALIYTGCRVPITRSQVTTNGVNFGWLYDKGLVTNNNMSTAYQNAANVDDDGDGFSNAEEYAFNTNPKSQESIPKIKLDLESKKLSWNPNSATNWSYVIQKRTNLLSGTWKDIATNSSSKGEYTITPTQKSEFYKVEARHKN